MIPLFVLSVKYVKAMALIIISIPLIGVGMVMLGPVIALMFIYNCISPSTIESCKPIKNEYIRVLRGCDLREMPAKEPEKK